MNDAAETKWFCTECDRDTVVTSTPDDTRCVVCGTGRVMIAERVPSISEGVTTEREDHVVSTFMYYLADAENGYCKIPRRVADDLSQSYKAAVSTVSAISAELEQTRRQRDEAREARMIMLNEKLAGGWREQPADLAIEAAEARAIAAEAENARLRQALRNIAEGNLGDASWQANYDRIRHVARSAITEGDHHA